MRTLAGSSRFADFSATTSTLLPPAGSAWMSPLTPLISIECPCATGPDQWKSSADAALGAAQMRNRPAGITTDCRAAVK